MLYLITYDLKNPGKNYNELYDAIKQLGRAWWHYMDSVWLVQTQLSVDDCNNSLRPFIDNNDFIFVVDITNQARQGWLPEKAWNWIREHNN